MSDKATFARSLQSLMRRDHITQTALASALGLTSSAVSLWCTGKAYPEVSVLIKLAEYFNVSTDYLLSLKSKRALRLSDSESENKTLFEINWGELNVSETDKEQIIEFLTSLYKTILLFDKKGHQDIQPVPSAN